MLINLFGHISYFLKDFHEFIILILITFIVSFFLISSIYRSKASDTGKKIKISLVFFLISFILVYSGFEAFFRYRFDESDSLGFLNVTQRWYQRHVLYNNYQYRDKNFTIAKTSGVVRIGVMGDSNAWGYGIKNVNNRFSNILEKELTDHGYHVEVYNFGVPGLDTWNEIDEYHQKDAQFHVDILLWSYFLNDVEPPNSAGTAVLTNAGKGIPPLVEFLSNHSFFFDYLYWRLSSKYNTTFTNLRVADIQQYHIPAVYDAQKKRIDTFTQELKNNNIPMVVLIFPFMKFFPNYPAGDIHTRMDKVFKDDGVTALVDMLPYLKGRQSKELVVNRYDTHPNEFVHKLTAEKLYTVIAPLLEKTKEGTRVKN
ncbi:MAG TPA: SGNH/GDSL hydrolase family protein [Candidatus Saccharimonadales bacterium]|nr:SGNH/GDSL hydrolase family protein [Candidatus Saccharimonadales bacterium]